MWIGMVHKLVDSYKSKEYCLKYMTLIKKLTKNNQWCQEVYVVWKLGTFDNDSFVNELY